MPEPIFSDLYRDTEHLRWEPVEQVRRRGRQRTRRTRIAAGLAAAVAVAVIASGAAALGRPDTTTPPLPPATAVPSPPTPTPDRTADPTPTGTPSRDTPSSPPATSGGPPSRTASRAIPAAATLQLADLPRGFTMAQGKGAGDWTLESATANCDNKLPQPAVGVVATRFVQFDSPTDWVVERVTRHSGTGAASSMQRARRIATECVPARSGDSLSIMAEGLAGDDSLLIGGDIKGIPSRWLLVRQGDLVAQLRLNHQTTPAEARRFAKLVAPRLCAGTDAC